ncbi:MAG: hypothetical protein K0R31_1886, partial [Clostridiales bacterium]|nr:hypothetical protein [Clostridiales bacterium]
MLMAAIILVVLPFIRGRKTSNKDEIAA